MLSSGAARVLKAEREGFEPPDAVNINGFQDRRDRPLRHLSISILNLPGFELSMLVMASGSRSCSEAIRLFAIDECKGKHFLLVYPNFCSSIFLGFSEISLNQPNLVEISCN